MKKIIRLSENDLLGIIERILSEQTIPKPKNVNFGYRTAPSDATQTYIKGPSGQQIESNPVSPSDVENFYSEKLPAMGSHELLGLAQLVFTVAAMIPTPASPFLLALGTIAGVADGVEYIQEGDKYMGAMFIAISLIPGGELVKAAKFSRVVGKRGIKGTLELIKKYKAGGQLAEQELKDLMHLGATLKMDAAALKQLTKNAITSRLKETLKKQSPKYLISLLKALQKLNILGLPEIVIKIGSTLYTVDQLYLYIYRDVFYNKKDLDSRQKNQYRILISKLAGHDEEIQESMVDKAAEYSTTAAEMGAKVTVNQKAQQSIEAEIDALGETPTSETQIYKRKGDPYEYTVISNKWYSRKSGTNGNWMDISKYQNSIDILNNEFPNALKK